MSDNHRQDPNQKWAFNESVEKNFPEMLSQSIPGLDQMRWVVERLARRILNQAATEDRCHVIDVGSSRGDVVASLIRDYERARFSLCEISPPMIASLQKRFGNRVDIIASDLSEDPVWLRMPSNRAHLITAVLVLCFIPLECRQVLVQRLHDLLHPGGAMIVVEKTLGDTPAGQQLLTSEYHAVKVENGYDPEEVERKRLSLKGALVPCKTAWTEDLLRDAGFVHTQQVWRSLQFVGWITYRARALAS